jgi:hypothetical protein
MKIQIALKILSAAWFGIQHSSYLVHCCVVAAGDVHHSVQQQCD